MNPNALLTEAYTPASVDVHRYMFVVWMWVGILGVLHPWQQVWWDETAITQSS